MRRRLQSEQQTGQRAKPVVNIILAKADVYGQNVT